MTDAIQVNLKPFQINDPILKTEVSLRISPFYVVFRVGKRDFFINRADGEFDGTGLELTDDDPEKR